MKNRNQKKEFINKKARFNYSIGETLEAGIVLTGHEIKAVRDGRISMNTSYAKIMGGELWWIGGTIQNIGPDDPQRTRKLLVKTKELFMLSSASQEKGETIVPLKLYIKRGRAKLLLGLGKGRKKFDKRDLLKDRDRARESERTIKSIKQ